MFSKFVEQKFRSARYKILKDGSYFGEIPGFKGVWANAKSLEGCRQELREILEEWLLLKVRHSESVPGFRFRFDRRELVKK